MVAGVLIPLFSSNEFMVENPRSMNCGVWVWTGSSVKFILQRLKRSPLAPLESLWPITLLKMDAKLRSSGKISSTTVSSFWFCPTKLGELYCRLFATSWVNFRPQGGAVATITIMTGEGGSKTLTEWRISPGVLPLTPVHLYWQRVVLNNAPPNAVSARTSFVAFANSVCGANEIGAITWSIPGLIAGGKIGMIRLLNIFCSKSPLLVWVNVSYMLLVWVTFSWLRVISPCDSLAVAVFD